MRKTILPILVFGSLVAAEAQNSISFRATLSGTAEVPPNASSATGTAYVELSGSLLCATVNISGLTPEVQPFIYGPAGAGESATAIPMNLGITRAIFCDRCPPGHQLTYILSGTATLTSSQTSELLGGKFYINIKSGAYPEGEVRGQILLVDTDEDGVPDYRDECPDTPAGPIVNSHGCSLEQLCPCDGPWRNHGEYVNRVRAATASFMNEGLVSAAQARSIIRHAAASSCGRP